MTKGVTGTLICLVVFLVIELNIVYVSSQNIESLELYLGYRLGLGCVPGFFLPAVSVTVCRRLPDSKVCKLTNVAVCFALEVRIHIENVFRAIVVLCFVSFSHNCHFGGTTQPAFVAGPGCAAGRMVTAAVSVYGVAAVGAGAVKFAAVAAEAVKFAAVAGGGLRALTGNTESYLILFRNQFLWWFVVEFSDVTEIYNAFFFLTSVPLHSLPAASQCY